VLGTLSSPVVGKFHTGEPRKGVEGLSDRRSDQKMPYARSVPIFFRPPGDVINFKSSLWASRLQMRRSDSYLQDLYFFASAAGAFLIRFLSSTGDSFLLRDLVKVAGDSFLEKCRNLCGPAPFLINSIKLHLIRRVFIARPDTHKLETAAFILL
jgi:hypothetical protein